MTAAQYRRIRTALGTQAEVAKMLELTERTLRRRERGEIKIDMEAALAIERLYDRRRQAIKRAADGA